MAIYVVLTTSEENDYNFHVCQDGNLQSWIEDDDYVDHIQIQAYPDLRRELLVIEALLQSDGGSKGWDACWGATLGQLIESSFDKWKEKLSPA